MKYLLSFLLLIFFLALWMLLIEPNVLTVKKITIKNKNLTGLRIVFAADFHIKPYEAYRLKRTVKLINMQNPDIVLLGGDYVNGHNPGFTMEPEDIASELSNLKSKYGTYAVIGNHDGWQGKYKVIKAFTQKNITVLDNENKNFGKFTVAGIDDLQTGKPDIKAALRGADGEVIMLTHTPDMFPEVPESVILTLAGHLHGGQVVFPGGKTFFVPSKYGEKYLYGLKKENGKYIFTSKGLGTSIIPVRLNCFPEIVVIDFTK